HPAPHDAVAHGLARDPVAEGTGLESQADAIGLAPDAPRSADQRVDAGRRPREDTQKRSGRRSNGSGRPDALAVEDRRIAGARFEAGRDEVAGSDEATLVSAERGGEARRAGPEHLGHVDPA